MLRGIGLSTAAAALTGCVEGSFDFYVEDGEADGDDGGTRDDVDAADGEEADAEPEELERARELLGDAADDIKRVADPAGDVNYGDVDVESRLNEVEEALGWENGFPAEDGRPPEGYGEEYGSLAELSRGLSRLDDALERVDTATDDLDRAVAYFSNERVDDASMTLTDVRNELSIAEDVVDDAEDILTDVDEGAVDELRGFDATDLDVTFENFDEMFTVLVELTEGFTAANEAFDSLQNGFDSMEAENWSRMEDEMTEAEEGYVDAEAAFEAVEEDAPAEMIDVTSTMLCFAGSHGESAGYYADAASAAEAGDWGEFEHQADLGEDALESC